MIKLGVVGALAGLAAAAALAGCATQGPAAVASADGPRVLADIIAQVYGTQAQRDAGQQKQFYAWHGALGGCMTGKGETYELPGYGAPRSVPTEDISPGDMLAFGPRRTDWGIGAGIVADAKAGGRVSPSLAKLSGDAAEQWIKVQNECAGATKKTENLGQPDNQAVLDQKLIEGLAAIQNELAPDLYNTYKSCMAGTGITVTEKSFDDAYLAASRKYPAVSFDSPSDPTDLPGWDEAVAYETQTAADDWSCRGEDATRVVNASGEKLTAWATAHQAELDAVARAWADIPAQAAAAKQAALQATTK